MDGFFVVRMRDNKRQKEIFKFVIGRDRHRLDWQKDRKRLTLIDKGVIEDKRQLRLTKRQKKIDVDRCRIE